MAVPQNATGISFTASAGQAFTDQRVASFSADPSTATPLFYAARITWGDGAYSDVQVPPSSGQMYVTGSHTYAAPGTYQVSVFISEPGQINNPTVNSTATVNAATPTPAPTPTPTPTPQPPPPVTTTGGPLAGPGPLLRDLLPAKAKAGRNANFALPPAPGSKPVAYYLWDFGDGSRRSTPLDGVIFKQGVPTLDPRIAHRYRKPGAYNVSAQVVGKDGSTATIGTKVFVSPAAGQNANKVVRPWKGPNTPTIRFDGAVHHPKDQIAFTAFQGFAYNDLGQPTEKVDFPDGQWFWGDGTSTNLAGKTASDATHAYASPGDYTVKFDLSSPKYGDIEVQAVVHVHNQVCSHIKVRGVYVTPDPGFCLEQLPDGGFVGVGAREFNLGGFHVNAVGNANFTPAPVIHPDTGAVLAYPIVKGFTEGVSVSSGKQELGAAQGFTLPNDISGNVPGVIGNAFGLEGLNEHIDGLRVTGGVLHLVDGNATVDLAPPAPFGNPTKPLTTTVGGAQAADVGDLTVGPFDASYGPIEADGVVLHHDSTGWHGGGNLKLFPPDGLTIHAPDDPARSFGFGFSNTGQFRYAGATVGPISPPIEIGPFGITQIGANIRLTPFFLVSGRVSLGIPFAPVVTIDNGCFAFAHMPADVGGTLCDNGVVDGPHAEDNIIRAEGTVSLFHSLQLGGAAVDFHTRDGGFVDFGGHTDFTIVPGWLTVHADISGDFFFKPFGFQLVGDAGLDIRGKGTGLGGQIILSSRGVAACVTILGTSVGGQYLWGVGAHFFWHGCDYKNTAHIARELPTARSLLGVGTPRVSAFGASDALHVTVPGGHAGTLIAVTGMGGAPSVTVVGPNGERFQDSGTGASGPTFDFLHVDSAATTLVVIAHARPGVWTITANPGSPTLTGADVGSSVAKPRIQASVTGSGHNRVLRYRMTPQSGQQVTFVEQGDRGVQQALGAARGNQGTIMFHPFAGPSGRRSIVALVTQDGNPRTNVTVASYTAPPPTFPGRVPGLRVRRRGGTLTASWGAASNAAQYAVSATIGQARAVSLTLSARSRSVSVPQLLPTDTATVSVVAVGRDARRGPAATSGLRASKHPAPLVV